MNIKSGTYILVMAVESPLCLEIGKLGSHDFPKGYYLYAGSALGGLAGRLKHHFSVDKHFRWHIDYLLRFARIVEIWYSYSQERLECIWNRAVTRLSGAMHPAPKFGASDCRCLSHLTHVHTLPLIESFVDNLEEKTRLTISRLVVPNYQSLEN